MEIRPIQFDEGSLKSYEALFARCFPPSPKFGVRALQWLYTENPAGKAVGFDAWEGGTLAAHYVCVPALINYGNEARRMLLSLNTATHPDFQGKGLFTKLAQTTYETAATQGYAAIHGVANANSTPGFIRKLGFQLVQPLEARIGVGPLRIDRKILAERTQFQRAWKVDHLQWRCANPVNAIRARTRRGISQFFASAKGNLLPAYAQLEDTALAEGAAPQRSASPLRLFLGLYPEGGCDYRRYVEIPRKLRPSPLNFIFLPLQAHVPPLKAGAACFSFLDFDAY